MTVPRLIRLFSSWAKPVQVGEVRDQIVEWGYFHHIKIAPFDKPPERLSGLMINYVIPLQYGGETECCVVRFNQNLPVPLQRLVCVKELVHSIDNVVLRVSTKVQLNTLLDQILHSDGVPLGTLDPIVQFEDIAVYQALAILGSEDAREDLFHKYHATPQQVTLEDVATRFGIPVEYASWLMLPNWRPFRDRLLALP